ncbi:MAG TPA: serine hydrolase domain-containing protein [Gemmatimonadaceae bacterium]|nr:serine hydrolase domain-containing protein [Gemmatimonadaceae bacterium]
MNARQLFPVFASFALSLTAGAQRAARINPNDVDSIIRRNIAEKHIIGVSVGIMQNGQVVFARGYGVANLPSKAPVTPSTMFAIGSVTKQFTCSSVLMLQEQSKLSINDPVSKYFPNLTRANDITLKDVGGHLSGYRDYYPLDYVDREMAKAEPADTIIARYAMRPLDFDPRSRWSYSNTGFLILGRVVEKVSGQPIGTFFQTHIFTPLKLDRTKYEPAPNGTDLATGYTSFGLSDPIEAVPEAKGWAGAAGAIWSTPTDLLTWDLSLLNHTLISPASYAVLTTPQHLTDGRSSGYGCGEGINDRGNAVTFSHGGAVSGFVAQNTIIPNTKSALVVLSNSDFSPVGALNQELLAKLLPSVDVPVVHGASALDAAKKFLTELEQGRVDRTTVSPDFDAYLTADKIATAQRSLRALGPISNIRIANVGERGGLEVATVQFNVGSTTARGLMYRTPEGKLEEFLFSRS